MSNQHRSFKQCSGAYKDGFCLRCGAPEVEPVQHCERLLAALKLARERLVKAGVIIDEVDAEIIAEQEGI